MSKELVKTTLHGYNGPVCATEVLQNICDENEGEHLDGNVLEEVARRIEGYKERTRPTTIDGYGWFWALSFLTEGGEIMILIPWAQDFDKTDGSKFDRAIAVYTKGSAAEGEIFYIQANLVIGLREFFAKRAGSIQPLKAQQSTA